MGEAAIVMKYDTIHHVLGKEGLDVKGAQQSNRPEMVVAYYACFKLGAIAAPLRTAFTFAELAPMLQRLKPALYIGEIDLYKNVVNAHRLFRRRQLHPA
jgi:acyl-CoA synthetase (AMP-forming)/AMP-acid ligase II